MTTKEAVKTWKQMRDGVTYAALQDQAKHSLVHEVFAAINRARLSGELQPSDLEAL